MVLPLSTISGDWSKEKVFLIGGGTSIADFDFSKIVGNGVTVGGNRVAFELQTDVLISIDQNFVRHYRDEIQGYVNSGKEAVLAMPVNEDGHKPIDGAVYVIRGREPGLSVDPRTIYGVNTGYAALGLAFLRGAKDISLLGYDMGYGKDGKTHFHSGYAWHNKNAHRFMNQWAKAFDAANKQLQDADCKIINYIGEPESKIEWFEKRSLNELATS